MAKPIPVTIDHWNQLIGKHARDSDRAIAVWAGSFVENHLALFLQSKAVPGKASKELFESQGPLNTFGACTKVAFAFKFIDSALRGDLDNIRKVRNHFAHHPLHAAFDDAEIAGQIAALRKFDPFEMPGDRKSSRGARQAYLEACGMTCAMLEDRAGGPLSR